MTPPRPSKWIALALLVSAALGCTSTPPAVTPRAENTPPQSTPPVFALAASVADTAEDPADRGVASRITKVTVYSDRALVSREAAVALTTEPTVFRFKKLPGWVDEGSVRAATSAGKIVDVVVERRFLARSTDEGFRKVEEKHRALLRKLQALDDELAILNAQQQHVESIKVFSVEKLEGDAVTKDIKVDTYGQVIDFVSGALRKTSTSRREVQAAREQLAPDVEASARNLEELRRLTKLEETTVLVTVQGTAAANASLTLTYATPGATWEPMHEVRASAADPDWVELTSFAVVTQTTGEDWSHAELSFSTQSSSDSERIPELEMLALGKTQEVTRSVTRQVTSFSSAQKKFEEQNRHWNRMNQASSQRVSEVEQFDQSYSSNLALLERVQSKTVQIFQGLQTRGTTAHFIAKDPAIVRSDGRSIRLRTGSSRIKAQRRIIAAPEESLNAAVTLEMANKTGQPLLPGSVARYQDGAFLGMTDIDFVTKDEDFSVFFSVADQVKLTRELDKHQSSLQRNARNRMQLSFVSKAKNLSDRPVTVVLAERIPVSENTEIRVSNVKITPNEKPDAKGIVRFTMTLAPREEREFRVSYQVEYPPSLVFDVRRKQMQSPPSPSPAAPKRKIDFEERLIDIEQQF
ncbi:mucoidy inhibitor MuiA family protein [Polyangium sorediatum]|uniref:Mucoidy inhibitor MuiA family protein n=1 Tax=Polyangium sorediatum TaxID=889274 RepID=A0ABT6P623_9BACT|nr:mucoidy inhibitor MuiA family protein [Polyangium sorediatum]MDI1435752.1 mucoidy inhibitor MuiA family protein [Polyangium sorediatum]